MLYSPLAKNEPLLSNKSDFEDLFDFFAWGCVFTCFFEAAAAAAAAAEMVLEKRQKKPSLQVQMQIFILCQGHTTLFPNIPARTGLAILSVKLTGDK